jgi:hypothetical protein
LSAAASDAHRQGQRQEQKIGSQGMVEAMRGV